MARRGFFAELQHRAKVAAREQAKAEREAERAHNAAVRDAERARKADERAAKALAHAEEAERKEMAKLAREAHIEAMEADVEMQNLELVGIYDEIDSLLEATLDVDDFVDLELLRPLADHPPFDRPDLEVPTPGPGPIPDPPEPVCTLPEAPKGLRGLFGGKKHAKAVTRATETHKRALAAWEDERVQLVGRRSAAAEEHAQAETQRTAALKSERARYARECAARESQTGEQNSAIDTLIANLGYGDAEAVQEYISIVLSNSVYPTHFPVEHDFTFDSASAELQLQVRIPGPDQVPNIKLYKYSKSADEVTSTTVTQKASKDRYSGAVHQVALRSLHEVFEADRRGIIKTIALEVGTETLNPGTGLQTYVPFVSAAAERGTFLEMSLANVIPAATLKHLNAAVSKNPYGLEPADTKGVRGS